MDFVERIDSIDLPVDSKSNRGFLLLDEIVYGFFSIGFAIKLCDQTAYSALTHGNRLGCS